MNTDVIKAKEAGWNTGPRTLLPPAGASDVVRDSIANTPQPDVAAMAQGVLTLTFAPAMVIGNLGAGFVAENMSWMWVPALMAVLCGLGLVVGLRGRRVRDQYLAQVAGEKEAEAANRVLGSS